MIERQAINMVIEVLEKHIPMKVTDIHVDEFYCPNCGAEICHEYYGSTYHPNYCKEGEAE